MKKFSIKRLVLFTFFAALVTLVLNACGGGGGSTGSTPTPPATTANPISGTVLASYVNGIKICVDETVGTSNEICTTSAGQGNFTLQNAEGKQLSVFIANAKIGTISASQAVNGLIITPALLAGGDTTKEIKIKALFHQGGVKTGSGDTAIYDLSGIKNGDIDLGAFNNYLNGTNKTVTIGAIVVNSDNEISNEGCDFTSVPLVRERCFGGIGPGCEGAIGAGSDKHENNCSVDGWMSVGSILHDKCCVATNNAGYNCNNPWGQINTGDPTLCKVEWQEAWDNTQCSILGAPRQWHVTFGPYPARSIGDNTNVDLRAPDGTRVNPKYQGYCRSGRCEIDAQCNTIIKQDLCFDYCVCSSSEYILSCPDIAGKWNFTSSGVVTCSGGGETDTEYPSGSGTACINQNGCNVSWIVPGTDYSRSGTVTGNSIQVSGIFVVPLVGGVNITQNSYSASGTISEDTNTINLNGEGSAAGSYEGIGFTCTGTDEATLTRLSSTASTLKTMDEKKAIREPSLMFLNNSLRIFTIVSPKSCGK